MKVAIISNLYPPHARGGAEQVVVKTVQGLRAAGHEVVVITAAPKGDTGKRVEDGVMVYRFTPSNIFFYTDAHKYHPLVRICWHIINAFGSRSTTYVQQILQEEQPDVVHTHNLIGIGFGLSRMISQLGIRHVHTVHDVQLVEPSGIILKQLDQSARYKGLHVWLYTAVMKRLMGSPQVVISPSQFLLDFYVARGFFPRSAHTLLRNPVRIAEIAARTTSDVCRFLYLGQVESHKGALLAVRAAKALPRGLDWELTVAGDGAAFDELKREVAGDARIRVLGRIDRSAIGPQFAKTDVTIVPSLCYENSPTVIFESFVQQVPVIASNVEGIAELIDEEVNGKTFETGNQKALTGALMWACTHKTELPEMGRVAREGVIGLSLGNYISALESLYSD